MTSFRRWVITGLAAATLMATTAVPASAAPTDACTKATGIKAQNCKIKAGDLHVLKLKELHPTQPSLGYDEVYYKLGRYSYGTLPTADGGPTKGDTINKKYDDWCESYGLSAANPTAIAQGVDGKPAQPALRDLDPAYCSTEENTTPMKTAVVGPGGQMYLTDGHHTFTSFWQMPDGGPETDVRVKVTHNFGKLTPAQFWKEMRADKLTWLYNVQDKPIAPSKLPKQLGLKNFANDPYRGLLYFARDIGYAQGESAPPFQEFYWGDWLRTLQGTDPSVTLDNFDRSEGAWTTAGTWDNDSKGFLALVRNVATKINAVCPDNPAISSGLTAEQLGCLDTFGTPTFTELQYGYTNTAGKKPGKVAYSLKYKASL